MASSMDALCVYYPAELKLINFCLMKPNDIIIIIANWEESACIDFLREESVKLIV